MMKLYHGSIVSDLTMLYANSYDRQGNKVLFLTDNLPYGLFYIRDRDIDFVTCGVGTDGTVYYDEKFPDQLSVLYSGMSGYIYVVEAEAEKTKVNGIYVTSGDAKVTGVYEILDVYEAIKKEIEMGNVCLISYDNLTDDQKNLNHQGAIHMIRNCPMNPSRVQFFQKYFPDAWKEAHQN